MGTREGRRGKAREIIWILGLLTVASLLFLLGRRDAWVESVYATSIYPIVGKCFRILFGWLPLSLGDILYVAFFGGLSFLILRMLTRIAQRRPFIKNLTGIGLRITVFLLVIYIFFQITWGLNYSRLGIAHQLNLQFLPTDTGFLRPLTTALLEKTNAFSASPGRDRPMHDVFIHCREAYRQASKDLPVPDYEPVSIKASLLPTLISYMGTAGYYNPFTGEAQVNPLLPAASKPFVTCHEMAHQLGYARENEANLVGFLAGRASTDSFTRYAVYLSMFLYANREFYSRDSAFARKNLESLSPPARKDLEALRAFHRKYEGPADRFTSLLYGNFLRLNRQPSGMRSYNEVVRWLLVLFRKNNEI